MLRVRVCVGEENFKRWVYGKPVVKLVFFFQASEVGRVLRSSLSSMQLKMFYESGS